MYTEHIHKINVLKVNKGRSVKEEDLVAIEEPMEIRLTHGSLNARHRSRLSVTMRTPGNDFELTTGFLFAESIIRYKRDLLKIEHCPNDEQDDNQNVVRVELHPDLSLDLSKLDRNFYTNSACGLCGKTSIEAVFNVDPPELKKSNFQITSSLLYSLTKKSRDRQLAFDHTGGLHAAALFNQQGELLIIREDIGRHNAVDKVVGTALLNEIQFPLQYHILLLSGRAGFELVQKAVAAGIPIVAAAGAPSSLAVELAKESGMTLIGFLREERFNVYCRADRIKG